VLAYHHGVTGQNESTKVFVVVPTYNPPNDLPGRLRLLRPQVTEIVVVDDGSGASARDVLADLAADGIRVLRMKDNAGIAAALNRGVETALELGATHVLTVDQDSTLAPGYVQAALDAFGELEAAGGRVFAVGAGMVDGSRLDTPDRLAGFPKVMETLQSGLVFDAAALTATGLFDESLFIDCVDTEVLLRGAAQGYATYLSHRCHLLHQLGETIDASLPGGRRLRFAYHGPLRRYYITRNRAIVEARFASRFPRWAAFQLMDQSRYFLYCVLFGRSPGRQLIAAAAGLVDALRGRRGRITPRLAKFLQVA
jgi:rhamnosyltransferase